jgi:hypothetical protein
MTGPKLDAVITMLLATQGDPGFDGFNLRVFVIERDSNQTQQEEYVQLVRSGSANCCGCAP